ncbi:ABC transporter substrate-binding protein [Kitasatospora herbaricolor]|uniref:ABC transporter substrate-binding protein n=1 Tax=Kitasatospora herbaricolor TaxID=68217 RepID=UPI0036D8A9E9
MDGRSLAAAIAAVALALAASGCGPTKQAVDFAYPPADPDAVAGDLTVLTQRTDLVANGVLDGYAAEFERLYPRARVHFEGITDYEGEVRRRLGTKNYGDVLMIPAALPQYDYPAYFAPLGPGAAVASRYRFTDRATVAGKAYGMAESGSANGFVYNRAVWTAAGITDWPTTPAQFLADLQRIKDRSGSVPYYTNFKDAWPLTGWSDNVGSVGCDPQATAKLSVTDEPWAAGGDLNVIDTLLHDIVKRGLAERDPAGTDWERSKALLAKGDIATMQLGSWAVTQLQEAARKAGTDPAAIGFLPFPVQKDGVFCSVVVSGYQQAISLHSKNKAAARAWIDWFTDRSGAAAREGAVPTLAAAPLPSVLKPLADKGVRFIDRSEADTAQVDAIDDLAGIGLDRPDYRKKLIDMARGAQPGGPAEFFADLNRRWGEAALHVKS